MKNKLKKLGIAVFSHFAFHHIKNCRHCPVFKKCHGVVLNENDYLDMSSSKYNHNICKFFMYKIYKIKED